MDFGLTEKTARASDAAPGMGRETARLILQERAEVAFVDPMGDRVAQRAESLSATCDEAVESSRDKARRHLERKHRGKAGEVAATIALRYCDRGRFVVGANCRGDDGSVAAIAA